MTHTVSVEADEFVEVLAGWRMIVTHNDTDSFTVGDELILREHYRDLVDMAVATNEPLDFTGRERHAVVSKICRDVPSPMDTIVLGIRLVSLATGFSIKPLM